MEKLIIYVKLSFSNVEGLPDKKKAPAGTFFLVFRQIRPEAGSLHSHRPSGLPPEGNVKLPF